jgi:mono/diheme cytochrome c family protein
MLKALQIGANLLAGLVLAAAIGLVLIERSWVDPEPQSPRDFFLHGSTGTEIMPLAVFQVLPTLFPDQFQPAGPAAGDWIDQFGFLRGDPNVNEGLPYGVNISHYRPKSGAPSPIAFVGFNCAICHSSKVHLGDDRGPVILGMGNAAIDLVGFGDAVKTSLLDEKRLTISSIASTYEAVTHKKLGLVDKLVIDFWLSGARSSIRADFPMRGTPFGGMDVRNAALMGSGPARNEPIKETVRFLIDETPLPDGGYSKIPCLYRQDRREWAQYDGSVHDPLTRNSLAALGVGASIYNLRKPGILHTIEQTYLFVSGLEGPHYADLVTDRESAVDMERAQRGQQVYRQYCFDCHGGPEGADWAKGKREETVIPAGEIGTDNARVTFRYYDSLAQFILNFFPDGHPLKPKPEDLRTLPPAERGYIAEPLEAAFTRAPYLHNGSVPTLAQLINLTPRLSVFYRGKSEFDPAEVGITVTTKPDDAHYFRFDTSVYGNANQGHDYPWPYRGAGWDKEALRDLLEYLKTI